LSRAFFGFFYFFLPLAPKETFTRKRKRENCQFFRSEFSLLCEKRTLTERQKEAIMEAVAFAKGNLIYRSAYARMPLPPRKKTQYE
jgi:hypothetical protein